MSRRRRWVLGVLLLGCALSLAVTGPLLTRRMWEAVADAPHPPRAASLPGGTTLYFAVPYEDGRVWLVTAPWRARSRPPQVSGVRVRPLVGSLPPTEVEVRRTTGGEPRPGVMHLMTLEGRDATGDREVQVWVEGVDHFSIVLMPEPVDWDRPTAWLAGVATPFTFAVDLVTAPIHVLWIFATAGGHGPHWLPWCN